MVSHGVALRNPPARGPAQVEDSRASGEQARSARRCIPASRSPSREGSSVRPGDQGQRGEIPSAHCGGCSPRTASCGSGHSGPQGQARARGSEFDTFGHPTGVSAVSPRGAAVARSLLRAACWAGRRPAHASANPHGRASGQEARHERLTRSAHVSHSSHHAEERLRAPLELQLGVPTVGRRMGYGPWARG